MKRLGLLGGTGAREDPETRFTEETREESVSASARRDAASALIESHDRVFRRTARRYSICADDAEDAYQRALEILLTKAPPIEGDALVRWMQTVTKREALAVRRQRERLLGSPRPGAEEDGDGRDPLDLIAADEPGPNDRLARRERVVRSGEALKSLKPQEVRALTLKAEGYSYAEIGEITGWTYTKINRCMAEGRKRFLQVFAEIETGQRCEELADALSEMADGEGANGSTEALQFHLRSCAACRAKLRAYRAIPRQVFELMPAGPLLDQSIGGRAHDWVADRAVAAVDKVREVGYSLMSRGSGGGGAEATSVAAAGGTRGAGMAAIAKVLAICGATAAGGATCVATGVVDPGSVSGDSGDKKPAIEREAEPTATTVPDPEPAQPAADPVSPPPRNDAETAEPQTPVQQKSRQFNIESPPPSSPSASTSSDFGGPSGSSGGGSGGGGSGGSGGGFGIE